MNLSRTVEPTTEPVTLAETKAHLGVTIPDDDARIQALIKAAREWVESTTGQALISQTWVVKLGAFPAGDILKLPKPPIQSITSVAYLDSDGDSQTFTDYTLDSIGERIFLNYGEDWPTTQGIENAITITYIAGYSDVPESIKQAIKLQVEMHYDRPDSGYLAALESVCNALLNPYRDMRRL